MVKVRGCSTDGVAAVSDEMRNLATARESIVEVAAQSFREGFSEEASANIKAFNDSNEFMDEDGLLWMAASAELNSEHVIGRAIVRHAQSRKHLPPLEVSSCNS